MSPLRRRLTILAGLVLLGGVLLALLREPSGVAEDRAHDPRASAAGNPPFLAPRADSAEEPGTQPPPQPPQERDRPTVVDARTGEPVPSAEVVCVPMAKTWDDVREWRFVDRRSGADEAFAEGRAVSVDADGRLDLRDAFDHCWVVARSVDLLVVAAYHRSEGGLGPTLELIPPLRVEVVVLDARGRPVKDVPVVLRPETMRDHTVVGPVFTNASGLAVLDDDRAPFPPLLWDRHLFATVGVPLLDPPRAKVDAVLPPRDPVVLTLPPTGAVHVRVEDRHGNPYDGEAEVRLRALAFDGSVPSHRWFRDPFDQTQALVRGAATFPWVSVATRLELRVDPVDPRLLATETAFDGPAEEGRSITHVVALREAALVLRGRLVDEEERPLAGLRFDVELRRPGSVSTSVVVADDSGNVTAVFDVPRATAGGATVRIEGRRRKAERALPPALPDGDVDLGDVVLRDVSVLVSGTVTDGLGTPLPKAYVSVHVEAPSKERWSQPMGVTADERGCFEVRGERVAGRYGITAGLEGYYLRDAVAVDPPAHDVQVRLRRAGGISGSVVVPEGVYPDFLSFEVVGEPARVVGHGAGLRYEDDFDGRARLGLHAIDGRFSSTGLAPGTLDLLVYLSDDLLMTIADVEVRAGETNREARLQHVRVTVPHRTYRVRVADGTGKGVPEASVWWRTEGSDDAWDEAATVTDGVARVFALGEGPHTVVVTHPRHQTSAPAVLKDELSVALRPSLGSAIDAELPPGLPPLPAGWVLCAEAEWTGPLEGLPDESHFIDPRNREFTPVAFDGGRTARLAIRDPGTYKLQLEVRRRDGLGRDFDVGQLQPPRGLRVEQPDDTVHTRVDVDPEDYARVLERLPR